MCHVFYWLAKKRLLKNKKQKCITAPIFKPTRNRKLFLGSINMKNRIVCRCIRLAATGHIIMLDTDNLCFQYDYIWTLFHKRCFNILPCNRQSVHWQTSLLFDSNLFFVIALHVTMYMHKNILFSWHNACRYSPSLPQVLERKLSTLQSLKFSTICVFTTPGSIE